MERSPVEPRRLHHHRVQASGRQRPVDRGLFGPHPARRGRCSRRHDPESGVVHASKLATGSIFTSSRPRERADLLVLRLAIGARGSTRVRGERLKSRSDRERVTGWAAWLAATSERCVLEPKSGLEALNGGGGHSPQRSSRPPRSNDCGKACALSHEPPACGRTCAERALFHNAKREPQAKLPNPLRATR